ncbi:hypothetical protein PIB30_006198 [Stylosanthes scabra]|uniref:Uncharacterized protein n=1 Tax=Stylosanthes scabra TaxID=79078 RepID=A0ABU6Y4D7_9FABA|nr:hypothetical protein [Stylosanthes scabra]
MRRSLTRSTRSQGFWTKSDDFAAVGVLPYVSWLYQTQLQARDTRQCEERCGGERPDRPSQDSEIRDDFLFRSTGTRAQEKRRREEEEEEEKKKKTTYRAAGGRGVGDVAFSVDGEADPREGRPRRWIRVYMGSVPASRSGRASYGLTRSGPVESLGVSEFSGMFWCVLCVC